jgi:sugar phosphate permease
MSLILSAGGIGGFVAARAMNVVITRFDGNWRAGWWLIGGMSLISLLVAALFVREKPSDVGQFPDGGTSAGGSEKQRSSRVHITSEEWAFAEVLRSKTFWLLLFGSVGMSGGFTQAMAHAVVHLQDLGSTSEVAAKSFSYLVVSTLIGKLMLGVFGDRIDPRYLWAIAVSVFGIGLMVLLDAATPLKLYFYAVCIGFGFGGGLVCMMTVMSNYFGSKAYASVIGTRRRHHQHERAGAGHPSPPRRAPPRHTARARFPGSDCRGLDRCEQGPRPQPHRRRPRY